MCPCSQLFLAIFFYFCSHRSFAAHTVRLCLSSLLLSAALHQQSCPKPYNEDLVVGSLCPSTDITILDDFNMQAEVTAMEMCLSDSTLRNNMPFSYEECSQLTASSCSPFRICCSICLKPPDNTKHGECTMTLALSDQCRTPLVVNLCSRAKSCQPKHFQICIAV